MNDPITGLIITGEGKIQVSKNPIDPTIVDKLIKDRLDQCYRCTEFNAETEKCKQCGCRMSYKVPLLYPLIDEKAINYIYEDGTYHFVCALKRW